MLRHWPGRYQGPDRARTRLESLGSRVSPPGALRPAPSVSGWVDEPWAEGHRAPFPAPVLGTRRHLHTFRLARCSPFRPPRFQLLIWKRKKKPAGRGGRGEVIGAAAPPALPACGALCRRISALPRPGAPPTTVSHPRRAPPLPVCPSPRRNPGLAWRTRGGADPGARTPAPLREKGGALRGRRPRALPGVESPGALLSRIPSLS